MFYIRHPDDADGPAHLGNVESSSPSWSGMAAQTLEAVDPRRIRERAAIAACLPSQRLPARLDGGSFRRVWSVPLVFTGNHCKGAIFHGRRRPRSPRP